MLETMEFIQMSSPKTCVKTSLVPVETNGELWFFEGGLNTTIAQCTCGYAQIAGLKAARSEPGMTGAILLPCLIAGYFVVAVGRMPIGDPPSEFWLPFQ